jgi:hypothetical protein
MAVECSWADVLQPQEHIQLQCCGPGTSIPACSVPGGMLAQNTHSTQHRPPTQAQTRHHHSSTCLPASSVASCHVHGKCSIKVCTLSDTATTYLKKM